ncbi:hypothetical protein SB748_26475 [Rhizobium sp. SIMBA_035]
MTDIMGCRRNRAGILGLPSAVDAIDQAPDVDPEEWPRTFAYVANPWTDREFVGEGREGCDVLRQCDNSPNADLLFELAG